MDFKRRRLAVTLRNQLNYPLQFNPFVFSKLFLLWVAVGIVGGVIAGFYWTVLEGLLHFLAQFQGLYVIPIMAVAGLLAGLVIHFLGDPGEMDLIVNNIRFKGGRLEPKNNPSMILSSWICIASGGSAGPEAPLVQVVGSTGTWIARKLRIKGEDLRSLSIAGMAAAFTALFGAPLGGSLFALEIQHHKHISEYYQALMPALVASCSSYVIFLLITHIGIGPTWVFPMFATPELNDFFYAMLYALAGTAAGWLFILTVRQSRVVFKKLSVPIYIKMMVGGLLIGTIAYFVPLSRYFSHDELNVLLEEQFTLEFLFILLGAKILAIAFTVTSGWRGGFIIPLFFVGATVGLIVNAVFPGQNLPLIMVSCMAAINACVTRTPISTTILLATLTGFHHFIPILFASLTGFFLAPKTPLINAQLGMKE
ncbi:chloride channel protein [Pontibacter akesuensis]|uniref:H+/Cl-antiporter ClcA n=1 Tax=Pontibacter akesuensis TaxID=388950 RepID=A0A1I7HUQ7_9BACT|nr:chloride channel protein [Pontibacter akesuensis]GHA63633.1 chloride channel protein [Pontibacter akesuensis]SFU64400.1 H+/Cl-antiporter ClcA [Pontibacter akesuensis]